MITLKNGERARIIDEVTDDLVPYCTADNPAGTCGKYDIYINLESGSLYAKAVA